MNLESFFFLFDLDSSGLKKGVTQGKQEANELAHGLSLADKATHALGESFKEMAAMGLAAIGGLFLAEHLVESVEHTAELNEHLGRLAHSMGINVEEMSAWGDAIESTGGSSESFNETVATMQKNLQMFATMGKSRVAPFFKELGIDMLDASGKARSAFDLLPEIAAKFEGMSKSESFGLGEKMGLDKDTILMLQMGKEKVSELVAEQKELGVVTDEDTEAAEQFHEASFELHKMMKMLYTAIGTEILPVISRFLHGITETFLFMKEHKNIIEDAAILIGGVLVGALIEAIATTTIWEAIAMAASVANAVMAASFLILPAMIALVGAAILLLWDDVQNWVDGNESMLGTAIGPFADFENALFDIIDSIIARWHDLQNVISDGLSLMTPTGLINAGVSHFMDMGLDSLLSAKSTPLNSVTGGGGGGNSTTSNTVNIPKIEINTQATDADGIASHIGDAMQKHATKAINHFDNGIQK